MLVNGMNSGDNSAVNDMVAGIKRIQFAYMLALEDLRDRYRRSYFGAGWIIIGFASFIGVKAAIFIDVFSVTDYDYFSHLTIGFAIWMLISNSVLGSVNLYVQRRNWILSAPIPYSVYALALVCTITIEFLLVGGAAIVLVALFGDLRVGGLVAVVPVLLVYAVVTYFLALLLAPIGARFRDIIHFAQTLMRLMFFATPVIWVAAPGTLRDTIATFNPFSYFIDILRNPLMGQATEPTAILTVVTFSVLIIAGGLIALAFSKSKVPLWL